jgi:RNA polymerase sigma-70 factor (ECF subfamily)
VVEREAQELAALVRGAQRGDAMAMDELLGVLAPYVARICGPVALQDGADAAQETLVAVFRNLGQLKSPEALFGWVRSIAVREAVRIARRRRVVVEPADPPSETDMSLAADIDDVLHRLSPEHRAVLTLRHIEGLDEQEVARVLALPVGTVRSRLFRARSAFRRAWR